jgi:ketosteroid isomerase-like protein
MITLDAQTPHEMDTLQTEVMITVKNWNTAFEQNQPETYFEFIRDDLTLFIPSSPYRIDGKSDDREEFEWSLAKGRTRVSLFQELQPHVQLLNASTAVVTYHNRGAYGPEGQEQITYLKETNVLVKENGSWRIVHIHVSK